MATEIIARTRGTSARNYSPASAVISLLRLEVDLRLSRLHIEGHGGVRVDCGHRHRPSVGTASLASTYRGSLPSVSVPVTWLRL